MRYLVIYIRTYRQSESLSRATYRSCCASQEPRTAPEKVLPPAIPKCTYYMRVRVVNLLPTALRPLPRDTITRGSPTQPSAIFLLFSYMICTSRASKQSWGATPQPRLGHGDLPPDHADAAPSALSGLTSSNNSGSRAEARRDHDVQASSAETG